MELLMVLTSHDIDLVTHSADYHPARVLYAITQRGSDGRRRHGW